VTLFKKTQSSVVSNYIEVKFGTINTIDLRSRIFDMTSYFQDGGHDVILRCRLPTPRKRWQLG